MKMPLVLVAAVALAVTLGATTAFAGGGNSGNAKACRKGGWMQLYRSNGTAFKNQGACVSYGAHGGQLVGPGTQHDCEAIGGTFGADNKTPFTAFKTVLWSCNGAVISAAANQILFNDCKTHGGSLFVVDNFLAVPASTCGVV